MNKEKNTHNKMKRKDDKGQAQLQQLQAHQQQLNQAMAATVIALKGEGKKRKKNNKKENNENNDNMEGSLTVCRELVSLAKDLVSGQKREREPDPGVIGMARGLVGLGRTREAASYLYVQYYHIYDYYHY